MRDQGAEVCYSCWCFMGVCAKPATLQLYCRGGWDYHCKSSAWRKKGGRSWKTEYAGKEKTASKMLESTYLWLLLPGGTTSGKFVFMTDALQTTCRSDSLSASFSYAETATLTHFSLEYRGQLMLVKNFGICRTFLWNGIISPGFMMKTSVGKACCRTQPSEHPQWSLLML